MKITEMSIWAADKPNNERSAAGVTFSAVPAKPQEEPVKIKCRDCVFVKIDPKACDYGMKPCKGCAETAGCKIRRTEGICPKQEVKWAAYECTNCDSEYHRSLLNVTIHGNRQKAITWCGCANGKQREEEANEDKGTAADGAGN